MDNGRRKIERTCGEELERELELRSCIYASQVARERKNRENLFMALFFTEIIFTRQDLVTSYIYKFTLTIVATKC